VLEIASEALNDREVLDDTPIGTLRVVEWGDTMCVAVMKHTAPDEVFKIVHTLSPGENPLNAVYGKRLFETPAIGALYDAQAETAASSAARAAELVGKDFRKAALGFLHKHYDAREAIAERITPRGR